jgi:hypothetical protein
MIDVLEPAAHPLSKLTLRWAARRQPAQAVCDGQHAQGRRWHASSSRPPAHSSLPPVSGGPLSDDEGQTPASSVGLAGRPAGWRRRPSSCWPEIRACACAVLTAPCSRSRIDGVFLAGPPNPAVADSGASRWRRILALTPRNDA